MTGFHCTVHGPYGASGYPQNWQGRFICAECSRAREEATRDGGLGYRVDYRMWSLWVNQSGIPNRGRNRSLENWVPVGRAQTTAGELVKRWATEVNDQCDRGTGLTLLGPPGVGKTHLCYGLVVEAHRSRVDTLYAVWPDVLDRHKATFGERGHCDRGLIDKLKSASLLVLDEVGVRIGSEFDQALLFEVIDTRYRNQYSTIVASNLTSDTLDGIGERTADRLRETNLLVVIPGESQRDKAAVNRDLLDAPWVLTKPVPPVIPFEMCIDGEMVIVPLKFEEPKQ